MLRRLHRSTLFPYTTLFRSERGGALELLELAGLAVGEHRLDERGPRRAETGEHLLSALPFDSDAMASQQDRKSTRLNSSHTVISYAVFCLKKKNKTTYSSSS